MVCAIGFTLLGLPSPLVAECEVCSSFPWSVRWWGDGSALAAVLHGGLFAAFLVLVFLVVRIVPGLRCLSAFDWTGIHLHPLAVIIAIAPGAELAGVAGIFLAIPVVAILTVSYRHWLEHRGSEGLADLLEPSTAGSDSTNFTSPTINDLRVAHPDVNTTPEEMARKRPDLTTGELKLPVED